MTKYVLYCTEGVGQEDTILGIFDTPIQVCSSIVCAYDYWSEITFAEWASNMWVAPINNENTFGFRNTAQPLQQFIQSMFD